ncbi:cellulose biosynthesis cyclic di-GMP-binding regulatory protein BcsB [Gracilibacillus suaedae]|uniref:cellulose biosynthesis cyclic di-GMP-binding regulatory protein BcsB n=1 Tax=Gracilibacillus suaedae TaxID=2820273 RepID=UPI001ABDBCC8|nr:cellulose biosynthesis cyclic di-GMP-binding regulatory protein BcsB [Gracilibacillus suaedae]
MRKILLLLIFFFTIMFSLDMVVYAKEPVELEKVTIEHTTGPGEKQPLVNESLKLVGPTAETSFYYEIFSEIEGDDNYVQFDITNSEILMEPSSFTVQVDGEPVRSISLEGETSQEVKILLEGSALEEGSHSITVEYSGIIMDGVCVSQHSSSNWLTIQASSHLNIEANMNMEETVTLDDYPRLYMGTESSEVQVIMPNDPSIETKQAAHMLANYLSNQSEENSISVVFENEVDKINGNVVLIGGTNEYESEWTKQALNSELSSVEEDSLYLSQVPLQQQNSSVSALVVLAEQPETIVSNIDILITDHAVEQLSGETVQISSADDMHVPNQRNTNKIELSDFGLQDVLLDSANTSTQTYYYDLPVDKYNINNMTLELSMKQSENINLPDDSEDLNHLLESTKLDVVINGVPHAVTVDSLEEDSDGVLTANIPIDTKVLQNNQMLTFQLESSGLRIENPCVSTDYEKWLYIFSNSKLIFTFDSDIGESQILFNRFPFPFANQDEALIIVLSDENVPNEDLQQLFHNLSIDNQIPDIQLVSSSEVNEEQLGAGNVIFIGSLEEHKQLQEVSDNLIVQYDGNTPQLDAHGFLQSKVNYYSFVQENVWNDDYNMVVFDGLQVSDHYVSAELLSYLRNTDNQASVAVQSGTNKFFTNQLEEEQEELEASDKNDERSQSMIGWIIGYIVLIIVIATLIYYFIKRGKTE